jgi:Protein of unknown function (DUF3592)
MRVAFFKHKIMLVVLALVIVFMSFCASKFFREIRSKHWPRATGIIAQCYLQRAQGSKGSSWYIPEVVYLYTVGTQSFAGTRIDFHTQDHIYGRRYAAWRLRSYPRGKLVHVYYDPGAPQIAVLEPGIKHDQEWLLSVGLGYIALLYIAFLCVYYHYVKVRAQFRAPARGPSTCADGVKAL